MRTLQVNLPCQENFPTTTGKRRMIWESSLLYTGGRHKRCLLIRCRSQKRKGVFPMSTTNIYRLSGIVLAVGGLIGVVAFVLDLVVDAHYPHIEDDTLLAATTSAWVIHVALLFLS